MKYVNDTYGHFAGDQMIVKVAQSIRIALGDAGMAFGMVEMKCLRSFREERRNCGKDDKNTETDTCSGTGGL